MLQRMFHDNNPFWAAMGRLFDLVELNLLWLLCCLPLVTAGPATAALCASALALVRGEETRISHDFFRSFGQHFRRKAAAGLLALLTGGFLLADVLLAYRGARAGTGWLLGFAVFFGCFFLLWAGVVSWLFPLLAESEEGLFAVVTRAFVLSLRHLPRTLLLLLLKGAALWVCHLLPGAFVVVFGLLAEAEAVALNRLLPRPHREEEA